MDFVKLKKALATIATTITFRPLKREITCGRLEVFW